MSVFVVLCVCVTIVMQRCTLTYGLCLNWAPCKQPQISAQSLHLFAEPFSSYFENIPIELLGNTLEEWGHCIASLEDNPGEGLDDAGLNYKALEVVKYATSFAPFYHSQMELRSCTHGRTIEKLASFW